MGTDSGNFVNTLRDKESKYVNIVGRVGNYVETSANNIGKIGKCKNSPTDVSWEITHSEGHFACHTMHQAQRELTTNIKHICQSLGNFGHIIMIGSSHLYYIY